MNELIDFVARRSGLDRGQAEAAVGAAIEYFATRLPSPVVGHIHELLHGGSAADHALVQQNAPIPSTPMPVKS